MKKFSEKHAFLPLSQARRIKRSLAALLLRAHPALPGRINGSKHHLEKNQFLPPRTRFSNPAPYNKSSGSLLEASEAFIKPFSNYSKFSKIFKKIKFWSHGRLNQPSSSLIQHIIVFRAPITQKTMLFFERFFKLENFDLRNAQQKLQKTQKRIPWH